MKVAIGLDVVELETYCHVVFRKRLNVFARIFKKRSKLQLKTIRCIIANNFIKNGFLCLYETTRLGPERTCIPQFDIPFDSCGTALLNC